MNSASIGFRYLLVATIAALSVAGATAGEPSLGRAPALNPMSGDMEPGWYRGGSPSCREGDDIMIRGVCPTTPAGYGDGTDYTFWNGSYCEQCVNDVESGTTCGPVRARYYICLSATQTN